MSNYTKIAGAGAALVLMAAPAWAAGPPATTPTGSDNPGTSHHSATPGPHGSAAAKARAYGRFCKTESKKHVKGEKGTPFSQCVTAMAKLAKNKTDSPREACKTESKKHVKGEKGTPFSRCVSGGAKLLKDQKAHDEEQSATSEGAPSA